MHSYHRTQLVIPPVIETVAEDIRSADDDAIRREATDKGSISVGGDGGLLIAKAPGRK
jgi:hypothetical protein